MLLSFLREFLRLPSPDHTLRVGGLGAVTPRYLYMIHKTNIYLLRAYEYTLMLGLALLVSGASFSTKRFPARPMITCQFLKKAPLRCIVQIEAETLFVQRPIVSTTLDLGRMICVLS